MLYSVNEVKLNFQDLYPGSLNLFQGVQSVNLYCFLASKTAPPPNTEPIEQSSEAGVYRGGNFSQTWFWREIYKV